MNADEARESLAFSEYARKRARDDMSRPWVALVLLASLSVVSLSLTEAAASLIGLFWAFVGPLGAGAIALYAYRRNRSSGIESSALGYVAITAGSSSSRTPPGRSASLSRSPRWLASVPPSPSPQASSHWRGSSAAGWWPRFPWRSSPSP